MNRYLLSLILLFGMISACGSESTQCSRTSDCFQGEVCDSGACIPDGTQPTNSTTKPNDPNSTNPNNTPQNNTTINPNLPNLACVADPFTATCDSPDDNDSFSEYFTTRNGGCPTRDDFVAMDETRSEQLCIREMRDRYTQGFVYCDTRSFIMEIHFTPKVECDRRAFKYSVHIDGKNCEEPNDEIRCDELPNGGVKVTAVVRPGRTVSLASFTLEALYENAIHFDYDLRWVMRE